MPAPPIALVLRAFSQSPALRPPRALSQRLRAALLFARQPSWLRKWEATRYFGRPAVFCTHYSPLLLSPHLPRCSPLSAPPPPPNAIPALAKSERASPASLGI